MFNAGVSYKILGKNIHTHTHTHTIKINPTKNTQTNTKTTKNYRNLKTKQYIDKLLNFVYIIFHCTFLVANLENPFRGSNDT